MGWQGWGISVVGVAVGLQPLELGSGDPHGAPDDRASVALKSSKQLKNSTPQTVANLRFVKSVSMSPGTLGRGTFLLASLLLFCVSTPD